MRKMSSGFIWIWDKAGIQLSRRPPATSNRGEAIFSFRAAMTRRRMIKTSKIYRTKASFILQ
jgi:hypothetical protein